MTKHYSCVACGLDLWDCVTTIKHFKTFVVYGEVNYCPLCWWQEYLGKVLNPFYQVLRDTGNHLCSACHNGRDPMGSLRGILDPEGTIATQNRFQWALPVGTITTLFLKQVKFFDRTRNLWTYLLAGTQVPTITLAEGELRCTCNNCEAIRF